jgi:hypothetical protein
MAKRGNERLRTQCGNPALSSDVGPNDVSSNDVSSNDVIKE